MYQRVGDGEQFYQLSSNTHKLYLISEGYLVLKGVVSGHLYTGLSSVFLEVLK